MKKIAVIILVLIIIAIGGYYYMDNSKPIDFVISENTISGTNGVEISMSDFPKQIQVSADGSFGISGQITGAKLSPDEKWLAISINGAVHDSGWIYNISDGSLKPIAFQYGGGVEIKEWKDNNNVIISVTTPKPETTEKVIDITNLPEYPKSN